jgi:hypothetical protein
MKNLTPWTSRLIIAALTFALCGAPELLAQTSNLPPTTQQPAAQQKPSVMPNPAQGPLQPPTAPLPDAPSATTVPPSQAPAAEPGQRPTENEPLGAAAAEAAKTSGGAASKPAGVAIAPAKQRQVRSWLIKLGAIGAAGAALGIVYGLSRSTSSVPSGATTASSPAR